MVRLIGIYVLDVPFDWSNRNTAHVEWRKIGSYPATGSVSDRIKNNVCKVMIEGDVSTCERCMDEDLRQRFDDGSAAGVVTSAGAWNMHQRPDRC